MSLFQASHLSMSQFLVHEVKSLSRVRFFATPWTVAYQASPSMGFSRQEYWSGLPFPSPGDFPDPGIKPGSLALEADALTSEPPGKPKYSKSHTVLIIESWDGQWIPRHRTKVTNNVKKNKLLHQNSVREGYYKWTSVLEWEVSFKNHFNFKILILNWLTTYINSFYKTKQKKFTKL